MKHSLRPRRPLARGAALAAALASVLVVGGTLPANAATIDPSPDPTPTTSEPSLPADDTATDPTGSDADQPAAPLPASPSPSPEQGAPKTISPAALGVGTALRGVSTGTAPFDADDAPGNDSSAKNDVLRSQDTVTYSIEVQINGSAQGDMATVTQTLPDGLVWPVVSRLPGFCEAGSTVSEDRRTLSCVVDGLEPDSVSTINLVATLTGDRPQGAVLTAPTDAIVVSATDAVSGAVSSATATPPPVRVSSSPRVNVGVARGVVASNAVTPDGVAGWVVAHDLYLSLSGYNTDGGRGSRGQSNISGDVTFDIDISDYTPNARFGVADPAQPVCAVGAGDTRRFPAASGGGPRAVTDSGTWTCTIDPANPRIAHVTVSGADLSAAHIPTQSADGVAIQTAGYLALGRFSVFVPYSDVPPAGAADVTAVLTDLVANGVDADGTLLPNAPEPLDDNTATAALVRREGVGVHDTRYVDQASATGLVPGQSTAGSGDGPVVAGQQFQQRITWSNRSTDGAFDGAIMCGVFDPKTQLVVGRPDGSAPTQVTASGGRLTPSDVIVEYGTTPTVDVNASRTERQQQLSATTCDDSDDTWTTDWAAAAATGITKVRVRPASGKLPAGATLTTYTNLQLRDSAELGKPVTETYSIKSSSNTTTDHWWHGDYRSSADNADYPRGDELIVANAMVSIQKRAVMPSVQPGAPAHIEAGDHVRFRLRPQIVSPDGLGNSAHDVTVTDSLPKGLQFDPSDVSPQPTSSVPQPDGTTLLQWDFSRIDRGSEPVIEYGAVSDAFALGDLLNRAIVASPDDPGSLSEFPASTNVVNVHYSVQTVSLSAASGLQISKTVDHAAVEPGDAFSYTVTVANMSADTGQQNARVIDVLPYPGDARGSTATARLSAGIDPVGGAVVTYTDADPAFVVAHTPTDGSLGYGELPAGSRWCTLEEFGAEGCPADLASVTAFEATAAELSPLQRIALGVHMSSAGAASGELFRNNASVLSDSQNLGARSATVSTIVVTSTIGHRLWWDTNHNGLDDDGPNGTPGDGVSGVTLVLTGVDTFGAAVTERTTTDADGEYAFTGLVSGDYTIEVELTDPTVSVSPVRVGQDDELNSAIDPDTLSMLDIVVVNPAPSGQDGLDTTWNGGLIRHDAPVPPGGGGLAGPGGMFAGPGGLASTGAGWTAGLVAAALALMVLGVGGLAIRRRRPLQHLGAR